MARAFLALAADEGLLIRVRIHSSHSVLGVGSTYPLARQLDPLSIEGPELLGDVVVRTPLERGQLRSMEKDVVETGFEPAVSEG
jgi:hypothetical protein